MTLPSGVAAFVTAAMLSAVLSIVARRLAWRYKLLARPQADRWNRKAVALLGGMAVGLTTLVVAWGFGALTPTIWPIAATGSVLLVIGLVDDWLSIKPSTKLSGQIAVASLLVGLGVATGAIDSTLLAVGTAMLWIVAITNAFNLMDNMDGLCAGIAVVAALAYAAIVGPQEADLYLYALALGGACLGFLAFNFPPASMFLGDAGSLFLGGSFAALTLGYSPDGRTGVISTLAVPLLVLLLPIFDTVFVTVSRRLSSRPASRGGRDHASHRLVALGFTERQTVLTLWSLGAAGGVAAWGVSRQNIEAVGLSSLLLVAMVLLTIQLARVEVYDGKDYALLKDRAFTPLLLEVTYKRRLFEVLLDTLLISIAYYFAYALRFGDDFRPTYYEQFVRSLPIAVACQAASLFIAGVYRGVWRYVGIDDLLTYGIGVALGWVSTVLALVYLWRFEDYSRGVFMIDAMLLFLLLVGTRLTFRWFGEVASAGRVDREPVIIYGAGSGGLLVSREMRGNPLYPFRAIAFLDDDPSKWHRSIGGISVLGGIESLADALRRTAAQVVVVSTSKLERSVVSTLRQICKEHRIVLVRFETRLQPFDDEEAPASAESRGAGRAVTIDVKEGADH